MSISACVASTSVFACFSTSTVKEESAGYSFTGDARWTILPKVSHLLRIIYHFEFIKLVLNEMKCIFNSFLASLFCENFLWALLFLFFIRWLIFEIRVNPNVFIGATAYFPTFFPFLKFFLKQLLKIDLIIISSWQIQNKVLEIKIFEHLIRFLLIIHHHIKLALHAFEFFTQKLDQCISFFNFLLKVYSLLSGNISITLVNALWLTRMLLLFA